MHLSGRAGGWGPSPSPSPKLSTRQRDALAVVAPITDLHFPVELGRLSLGRDLGLVRVRVRFRVRVRVRVRV